MHNKIYEISIAVLPIFLYLFLLVKIIPKQMVYHGRAKRYIVAGMIVPILVLVTIFTFPTLFNSDYIFFWPGLSKFIHEDYIRAGLLEESLKLLAFFYVYKGRRNAMYDLPIAIIFYNMACSAGFALAENIFYVIRFGSVLDRSYSAVLLHMITGIIVGFSLQKAFYLKSVLIEKESFYEKWKINFKRIKTILIGLIGAILFHGTYNFNFSLPNNQYVYWNMFLILCFGVVISKFMIDEGIRLSKELKKINYKKDYYENFR
jgi:RsiW-degrading membrane proteinase PrsW (M82 family)